MHQSFRMGTWGHKVGTWWGNGHVPILVRLGPGAACLTLRTVCSVCSSLALSCRIAQRFSVELVSVIFTGLAPKKRADCCNTGFCAFLVVRREFLSDMKILCWHLGRLCAWSRHVTITVTSVSYGERGNSKHVI